MFLATLALIVGGAQEPAQAVPTAARPPVAAPRVEPEDPTQPDDVMRGALRRPGTGGAAPGEMRAAPLPMPALAIKGLVVAHGKPGSAVIANASTTFHVETGSVLGGQGADTVRVVSISQDGVEVESQTTGTRMVVR